MTDSTLNRFLANGTNADRLAFTPVPPTPASGPDQSYVWFETDTGDTYAWNTGTSAWVKIGGGGGSGAPYINDPGLSGFNAAMVTKADSSGWSSTLTDLPSGMASSLNEPNGGLATTTLTLNGYTPPAAGTDFSTQFLFAPNSPMQPPSGGFGFGIGVTDNTGKFIQYAMTQPLQFGKGVWTNINSLSTFVRLSSLVNYWQAVPIWFQLARVGSNFEFNLSTDGVNWGNLLTESSTTDLSSTLVSVQITCLQNNFGPLNWTIYEFTAG